MTTDVARVGTRFELVARVGAGSFGEVWRARDAQSGHYVAVKRLHGHLDEPSAVARFLREATALSRVRNQHVVEYVAHGTDESDRPWLATEWIDGTDLTRLRSMPRMTRRRIVEVLREVAQGAAALHAAGLVHRDLKPSNVFVPSDGGPTRVVDLGVAHMLDGSILTDAGAILGTPSYMAPEQVRGDRVDPRADLWSIGVMLHELVAGETPFASPYAVAVLGRVLLDPAAPLVSLDPSVPTRLEGLVTALLDKDPAKRPANAASVIDELTRVLDDPSCAEWLDAAPRFSAGLDDTVASASSNPSARGERRWVAMLAARMSPELRATWSRRCESAGARVEVVRDASLVAFGMQQARGDELVVAARLALVARELGAAVALVAGWAEVRGGNASAGALIDRVAALLDRAHAREALVHLDGAERLEDRFELSARDESTAELVGARTPSSEHNDESQSYRVLGRAVAVVGRDKELALLSALVTESVSDQSARCALVIGDAGIGKSRLLAELRARTLASEARPRWIVLRGDPMTSDVPLGMLSDGLRAVAGIGVGEEAAHSALAWATETLGGAPSDALREGILSLFGFSPSAHGDGASAESAGPERAQRELDAFCALVQASLSRRPMVIAVEDLHWADRATVDALATLFAHCSELPLTLLALARPEVAQRYPTLWRAVARTELRLSPLSDRASEALIASVLEIPADDRKSIVRRAGGNPLFLEELVRARASGLVALPAAVHAVLQSRLDALGPEVRRVAQTASVFGPTFWSEGVAALRGARSVGSSLLALERAELVTLRAHSRIAHCTEYAFSHALARDAAYAMLVDLERESLHGRAVEWLHSVGERDPAVLAQHLSAAGRSADAAEQHRRAAQQALSDSAFGDAVEHCTRAMSLQPTGDAASEALLLRASANDALGETAKMLSDAETARDAHSSDQTLAIRARAICAEALFSLGRLDEADHALRAVLEESHASFIDARVQALVRLAEVDAASCRGSEANALIDEALAWLDDAGPGFDVLRVRARRVRATARYAAGDCVGALQEARMALSDAEALANRVAAVEVRATYGWLLARVGRSEAARVESERALSECASVRAPALRALVELMWAAVASESSPLAEAIAALSKAKAVADESGRAQLSQLAEARWMMLEALEGVAVRAPPAFARVGVTAAICQAALASDWYRRGEFDRAGELVDRAVQALGPRAEATEGESLVRWVQARVLIAQGRGRDADVLLSSAKERLERKASRFSTPADREQYLTGTKARRALRALIERRLQPQ